jgi:hypothetical protein
MSEIGHMSRSLRCNKQRPQRRDLAGVLYARRRFGGQEDLKAQALVNLSWVAFGSCAVWYSPTPEQSVLSSMTDGESDQASVVYTSAFVIRQSG